MFNRLTDLKRREVINITDGSRLGYVSDIEIDKDGKIAAIIVPGPSKFFGFMNGNNDFVIPYENVRTIGEDIILIEIDMTYNSLPRRKGFFEM